MKIDDINRSRYDFKQENYEDFVSNKGLSKEIILEISRQKDEPEWMTEFRLKSLEIYNNMSLPVWGPNIDELNIDNIVSYVRPNSKFSDDWEETPEYIKETFDKLGILNAEKESLAGVEAQYDSEVVYHNVREDLKSQGVIYMHMELALKEHEDLVKEYFMKLVPPTDHKFAALHGAVWSGGSFIYIPKGVRVEIPLQSYFRLNAKGAGQFEHTLIVVDEGAYLSFIEGCSAPKHNVYNMHAGCVELFVKENATLRYSTIENWSKNMFNLNTKRSLVEKNGRIEWVSGSFGSKVSMLYPMSILRGENATCDFLGISFASEGQCLDTGAKVVHAAPNTYSNISSKSIAKSGGVGNYRGIVTFKKNAEGSRTHISCDSLILDDESSSDTIPYVEINCENVDVGHEARIGNISDEKIFYLQARGLSEEDAKALIIRGFAEEISKELPLEYAVEMNNLINVEMQGL